MKTTRLKAALADLVQERQLLAEAISALEAVLRRLEDSDTDSLPAIQRGARLSVPGESRHSSNSYVRLTVRVLGEFGKPMNVKDLTYRVGILRGEQVDRRSYEATLAKHIKRLKSRSELERVRPGVYALSSWADTTKTLPALSGIS